MYSLQGIDARLESVLSTNKCLCDLWFVCKLFHYKYRSIIFSDLCSNDQKALVFDQKLEEHARKEKLRGNHVPSVLLKLYHCNLESLNVWRD